MNCCVPLIPNSGISPARNPCLVTFETSLGFRRGCTSPNISSETLWAQQSAFYSEMLFHQFQSALITCMVLFGETQKPWRGTKQLLRVFKIVILTNVSTIHLEENISVMDTKSWLQLKQMIGLNRASFFVLGRRCADGYNLQFWSRTKATHHDTSAEF